MKNAVLMILLAMLTACDGGFSLNDAAGKWQLTQLDGQSPPTEMRAGGVTLEIQADGKFAGQAPVNRYFGQIKIEGSAVTAGPVGATMMAGPPELMKAEQDYFKTLNAIKTISVKDGTLVIEGPEGSRLQFSRLP
jgi:heat shock protein HslJ